MNKFKTLYRNKPLLFQIVNIFLLCIVLTIGLNSSLGYFSNMKLYLQKQTADSKSLAQFTLAEMEERGDLEYLLPFWKDHYEELDIVYDDPQAIKEKRCLLTKQNPGIDFNHITKNELEEFPYETQKLYAEVAYMEMTQAYDNLKRIYHPLYLYCFVPVSDTEQFFYVTGTEEGEVRGTTKDSIYVLGSINEIDIDSMPILKKTCETRMMQDEMESNEGGYYHVYLPISSSSDELIGVIGVTLESNTLKAKLSRMLIGGQIISGLIFLVCGGLLIILVRGVVINPLANVEKNVKRYSENKDSAQVTESLKRFISQNEIGELAGAFSNLVVEIDRYTKEIENLATEKERISVELNVAKTIQEACLPSTFPAFPDRNEFELYAMTDPAKEVGGDFYDFFLIDDNHLGLVMADVSGKGIPAALFMMISKTLIKNHAMFSLEPNQVFEAVNNILCENNRAEMFVTAWLGVLEISTGKMICSNAGHEYPAIKRANGEFELLIDKHGFVLGGFEDMAYTTYEIELKPQDILFVYTDGVPEATSSEQELFGTDRMLEALNNCKGSEIKAYTDSVEAAIEKFVADAPQFDDLTMLAFKYK